MERRKKDRRFCKTQTTRFIHLFIIPLSDRFTRFVQLYPYQAPPHQSTPLPQRLGHLGRHHRFQLRERLLLEVALVLELVQLRPQTLRHRVLL